MNFEGRLQIGPHARLGIVAILFFLIFWVIGSVIPEQKLQTAFRRNDFVPMAFSDEEIVRGRTAAKQVIFTFDGGSGSTSGEQILAVLKKHSVKGTFFLTGKFVKENEFLVKQMHTEGHEIYNHTYNHPYLTELGDEAISKELHDMDKALISVTGSSSRPFFRAPFGDRNAKVLRTAFTNGYRSVQWTVDARDWEEGLGMTADMVKYQILSNLAPGTIYLMHIGDSLTGTVLDEIFTEIESRGYKIVSLTEGI